MRRLFVFRPEPGASQTIERARALGLDVTALPLFELETMEWQAPNPREFDGLLLTSANAVNSAAERMEPLRSLPVYAVGEATALAAEVAGFGVARVGSGGIDRLLESVPADARLLHLCGEDRRPPETPQPITSVVVYRARALPAPVGLEHLPGQVAMVHSPRAAQRLAELVGESDRGTVRLVAISPAAAEAAGAGWERIEAAREPTDSALLALAARLCET
jgi:uroporphyrinogen-III synthase